MNLLFIPFIPYININHLDCLTSHFDLRRGLVCKSSSNALLYAMMCTAASLYVGGSQIFDRECDSGSPRNSFVFISLNHILRTLWRQNTKHQDLNFHNFWAIRANHYSFFFRTRGENVKLSCYRSSRNLFFQSKWEWMNSCFVITVPNTYNFRVIYFIVKPAFRLVPIIYTFSTFYPIYISMFESSKFISSSITICCWNVAWNSSWNRAMFIEC